MVKNESINEATEKAINTLIANEQVNTAINSEEPVIDSLQQAKQENKILHLSLVRLEEESSMLREMLSIANSELGLLKKPALLVADITAIRDNKAIIKLSNGNKFYCNISKDIKIIKPGDTVLVEQKNLNVIQKIDITDNDEVEKFVIIDKPKENWSNVGGLKDEIREIKEVIELPLKKPQLFEKIGIIPPKGLLLYGPPGTGKTLLAKAAANSTNATFIEIVGSELVQKFIGEGAKLVKEIFKLARERAPAIIFIDEIDAIAANRIENGTSGEREVSRTFMQLLSELDGFKPLDRVKVIGATNRMDILDKAIIRPGRLDRLIEIGLPDELGRIEILKVHSKNMNLKKINLVEAAKLMDNFSGAEIRAACTEAGYFAIRDNRDCVTQEDFSKAIEKIKTEEEDEEYKRFFG